MAEVKDLNTTDASNTGTAANAGFPENMKPSDVNNAARALEGMIARWYADTNGSISSGGSSSTYTLAASRTISAYAAGDTFIFKANHASTGTSTINIDAVGATTIKKLHDQDLIANDIESGSICLISYDGTNFQLLSSTAATAYSDPLTTRGDIVTRGASATGRLAVGSANTVLKTDGTDPSWSTIATANLAADCVTGAKIADDAIDSEHYTDGSIDAAHLSSDCISASKIADDSLDSEHYIDGSIDAAHLSSDCISGSKIADNAIDSEHYTDGSIDLAHMSSESVDEDNLHISNSGSNGQFLSKQSGDSGGLTWADVFALDGTPGTDHTANGPQTNTFNSGYSSTIMDLVYMGSGGKWLEADADATGTSINMLAVALEAKTDTQAMNVALPGSFVRDDTWNWTIGVPLYVSTTLGAITATAPSGSGDVVRTVGFAVTADIIYFNPSPDYLTVA